jgi:hypothetical protein
MGLPTQPPTTMESQRLRGDRVSTIPPSTQTHYSRNIASNVTPELTSLFPGSVFFQTVVTSFNAFERQAWLRIGETLPPANTAITAHGAAAG